jgi:hypothetical protein
MSSFDALTKDDVPEDLKDIDFAHWVYVGHYLRDAQEAEANGIIYEYPEPEEWAEMKFEAIPGGSFTV